MSWKLLFLCLDFTLILIIDILLHFNYIFKCFFPIRLCVSDLGIVEKSES